MYATEYVNTGQVTFYKVLESTVMFNWSPCMYIEQSVQCFKEIIAWPLKYVNDSLQVKYFHTRSQFQTPQDGGREWGEEERWGEGHGARPHGRGRATPPHQAVQVTSPSYCFPIDEAGRQDFPLMIAWPSINQDIKVD